jgi:hypothetical protein
MAVGGHDPRRDLMGTGVFGLTGRPRVGGMIGSGAVMAAGEGVAAVCPQRHPVGAGMAGPARVGDLLGWQLFGGAASRPGCLARPGAVLRGVGVAAGPIQSPLTCTGPFGGPRGSLLLLVGAGDLVDEQLFRMPDREGDQRQVGHVGIHTGAPLGGDPGATRPGGGRLIPGPMYE